MLVAWCVLCLLTRYKVRIQVEAWQGMNLEALILMLISLSVYIVPVAQAMSYLKSRVTFPGIELSIGIRSSHIYNGGMAMYTQLPSNNIKPAILVM